MLLFGVSNSCRFNELDASMVLVENIYKWNRNTKLSFKYFVLLQKNCLHVYYTVETVRLNRSSAVFKPFCSSTTKYNFKTMTDFQRQNSVCISNVNIDWLVLEIQGAGYDFKSYNNPALLLFFEVESPQISSLLENQHKMYFRERAGLYISIFVHAIILMQLPLW